MINYRLILTRYHQVPTIAVQYTASSPRNAQLSQLDLVSNDEDKISDGEHKTRRQYYDDEDNIFYGEDKTRGKETLRNVVGERKLRRVFPATLYDGDDDVVMVVVMIVMVVMVVVMIIVIVMVITMVIMMEVTSLSSLMVSPM